MKQITIWPPCVNLFGAGDFSGTWRGKIEWSKVLVWNRLYAREVDLVRVWNDAQKKAPDPFWPLFIIYILIYSRSIKGEKLSNSILLSCKPWILYITFVAKSFYTPYVYLILYFGGLNMNEFYTNFFSFFPPFLT